MPQTQSLYMFACTVSPLQPPQIASPSTKLAISRLGVGGHVMGKHPREDRIQHVLCGYNFLLAKHRPHLLNLSAAAAAACCCSNRGQVTAGAAVYGVVVLATAALAAGAAVWWYWRRRPWRLGRR